MDDKEKDGLSQKENSVLFMEINKRCMNILGELFRNLNIYPGQVPILVILFRKEGRCQKEIAEMMHVKAPTVTVSIRRLEKSGIVHRIPDGQDQRILRIYLTEKGRALMEKGTEYMKAIEKAMTRNFTEAELCLMRRFFVQILENLEEFPHSFEENCCFSEKKLQKKAGPHHTEKMAEK